MGLNANGKIKRTEESQDYVSYTSSNGEGKLSHFSFFPSEEGWSCLVFSRSKAAHSLNKQIEYVSFQVLKKISGYIQEQNEKVYAPRGLLLTDPIERGMRVVSFHILSTGER